jgi:hypothetical protein
MIIRPKAVREIGGLREDLFLYGEDLEWCWRMRRAGWRIGVCSATTFVHEISSSAHGTFGEAETDQRIAAGIDAACRSMYGSRKAQTLAGLTAMSLLMESAGIRRQLADRARARSAALIWWNLARRSGRTPIRVAPAGACGRR